MFVLLRKVGDVSKYDCVHRLYIGKRNNGLCICSSMNVGSGNVGSRKIKENLIKYYKIDLWYYDKINMK